MPAVPERGRTQRLQHQFTAHVRDPQGNAAPPGIEDRRMQIYRDLVFSNIEMFLSANFPVIRSLYDDNAWDVLAHDMLREHEFHTPLFPEFGREFLRYLEARQQRGANDPPFLLEMAHYEWAELAISLDENDIDDVPHDPAGDPLSGIPVVSPLVCVLGYRYAVHLIGPDYHPHELPEQPTVLMLVRGRDDDLHFHEIDGLTALLIERLQANTQATGSECLDALLGERGESGNADFRQAGQAAIVQLKSREAILGTRVD